MKCNNRKLAKRNWSSIWSGKKEKEEEKVVNIMWVLRWLFASPWNSAMIPESDGMHVIRKVILSQSILRLLVGRTTGV